MKRRPAGTGAQYRTQTYRPDASMQVDGSNCGFVFGDTTTYSVEEYSNDNSEHGDYEDDTQEDQGDEDEYVIGHPFKEEGTEEMHGNTAFAGPSWRHQAS